MQYVQLMLGYFCCWRRRSPGSGGIKLRCHKVYMHGWRIRQDPRVRVSYDTRCNWSIGSDVTARQTMRSWNCSLKYWKQKDIQERRTNKTKEPRHPTELSFSTPPSTEMSWRACMRQESINNQNRTNRQSSFRPLLQQKEIISIHPGVEPGTS